ncbi:MAG: hypothetical protein EOL87_03015 [Spartobacteria bacterium]|nr:hypothetical protein [Spartobacteria bacterium]
MTVPLKILSFKGAGRVLPHTLVDVQQTLVRAGHTVSVLDLPAEWYHALVVFADAMVKTEPDIIFTVDHCGILPHILAVYPNPVKVIYWFYDDPLRLLAESHLLIRHCSSIYLWDRHYIEPLCEMGFLNVKYQHFGTNPLVYTRQPGSYQYDVTFVASHTPRREDMLRRLADQGQCIHLFGNDLWRSLAHPNVLFHGHADNRKDCPRIYSQSKININITNEQLVTSLPVRLFDTMACGGFILTDYREDVDQIFEPDHELAVYHDEVELLDKINYYLTHEAEREQIAAAGMKKVREHYTFDVLIPKMLDEVLHTPIDYERKMPNEIIDHVRAHWLMSLSFMRQGKRKAAAKMLEPVKDSCSADEVYLMAECALQAMDGNIYVVKQLLERMVNQEITAHKGDILSDAEEHRFTHWSLLYEIFFHKR